jgi:hypothetical protein
VRVPDRGGVKVGMKAHRRGRPRVEGPGPVPSLVSVWALVALAACGTANPPPETGVRPSLPADSAPATGLAASDPVSVQRAARAALMTAGSLPPIQPVSGPLSVRVQSNL